MRIHVESWSPDYGPAVDLDPELGLQPEEVELEVERPAASWQPIAAAAADPPPRVAFVDGVRRLDARLTVDDPGAGPLPGLCASCAAGAVIWEAAGRRSWVAEERVLRLAVLGGGASAQLPPLPAPLAYEQAVIGATDPGALLQHLQDRLRQLEAELARQLAAGEIFVVSDGRIHPLAPEQVLGYIKRQLMPYLPPEQARVVGRLAAGERTPIFRFGGRFLRHSWYLRLARIPGGHSWSGIARCECTGTLPLERVRELADLSAGLLPRFASAPHLDPRAPQNLVPIGALEKHLRRRLGDQALVTRFLRSALSSPEVPDE